MQAGFFYISSIKVWKAADLFLVSFTNFIFFFLIPPKATVCIFQLRLIILNFNNPRILFIEYLSVLNIGDRNIDWQPCCFLK